jgi:energy-coupling factor transport system permease protein
MALLILINIALLGNAIAGGLIGVLWGVLILAILVLLLSTGRTRATAVYAGLFAVAGYAEMFLAATATGAFGILVIGGAGFILRFLPSIAFATYLITTTRVGEAVAAMERKRVPRWLVIPLSVMLRFFPTVLEIHLGVRDGIRMRGLAGIGALRHPVRMVEYRVVPLLAAVVRTGDDLTAAALTRALGSPAPRTRVARIGFGWTDLLLGLPLAGIAIALGLRMGAS